MPANTPAETYTVLRATHYVAGRGTVTAGYYVADATGAIVAGPYTNRPGAYARACELEALLVADAAADPRTVTRGLDELRARRVAAALGVDLGPLTDAEIVATAALELAVADLGLAGQVTS